MQTDIAERFLSSFFRRVKLARIVNEKAQAMTVSRLNLQNIIEF